MKIGMLGLGKLGLPVALAIESKGHEVRGYDINPAIQTYLDERRIPFKEGGVQPLLDSHNITLADIPELVGWADIIFLAIQTPHEPQFEGSTRIPEERRDFDYSYLLEGIKSVATEAEKQQRHITLVVISTCLPGTYKREIKPLLNEYVHYVYNPFFIAMGTVLADFLNPEFVLLGLEEDAPAWQIHEFYRTIHDRPLFGTDITTAEGIKVFYNTFITMKTVLANTYGEMAHKLGMDVDDIYTALSMATDRIISPKYLKAGNSDGGGCHPRDNIALSYIAKKVNMSHNIFEDLMAAREAYGDWQADLVERYRGNLPVVILGRAFKPETNIETGSPAILLSNILNERGVEHLCVEDVEPYPAALYVIATRHRRYRDYDFTPGSIVIDLFRYLDPPRGCLYIPIGKPDAIQDQRTEI